MEFKLNISIFLLITSIVTSFLIIVYLFFKGRKTAILYSYVWCQILIFIWSLGQIFEIFSTNKQTKYFFVAFEYSAICFIGLAWLIFSLYYSNSRIVKNKKIINSLFIFPIVFFILVITNEFHHIFYSVFEYNYRNYGLFFWFHMVVSYIYLLAGTYLLIKYLIKQFGHKRKQTILLVFAVFIPLISNILHISKIINLNIDITPISFSVSLLLFAIAMFRYRFLSITSIALQEAVNSIREAIVIVDTFSNIVNYNNEFKKIFPIIKNKEKPGIEKLIEFLEGNLQDTKESKKILDAIKHSTDKYIEGEIILAIPEQTYFSVNIHPISKKNRILGRVITFNDISMHKKLIRALNSKNKLLKIANRELKRHVSVVKQLTMAEERNRLARDVHDTLGHTMTSIITLMDVSKIICETNPVEAKEKLSEAIKIAREGLRETRYSISGLLKQSSNSITNILKQLIKDVSNTGIKIELSVYGEECCENTAYPYQIYKICQEAITNSIRHGKANKIDIILRFTDEKIELFIIDNGCGCKEIKKGFGLPGMEERVKDLNGKILYGSDGESGFNINIEIPIKRRFKSESDRYINC